MAWSSAIRAKKTPASIPILQPVGQPHTTEDIDWPRLVTLDFETYYDNDYTLSKLSTSEYVRDPRFKAQMVGIKIGRRKTRTYTGAQIAKALRAIDWSTHSLLAHNTAFDAFILSEHYGIKPKRYYDTLSMARGLHSNEIGAGLDEVSVFYGGQGKIHGALESTKGVLNWDRQLIRNTAEYCVRDVDECFRIFQEMLPKMPIQEMDLIHLTMRMFCQPTLQVDVARAQAEYEREVTHRHELLLSAVPDWQRFDHYDDKGRYFGVLDKKSGRDELEGDDRHAAVARKVVGSNERYTALLVEAGVPEDQVPRKISPAWMNLKADQREEEIHRKWAPAFSRTDLEFVDLPKRVWDLHPELSRGKPGDLIKATAMAESWQRLVDVRLAVKSVTNITRAERFVRAGADGKALPIGYSYYRAHTGRFGGNNKMNFQNLVRGGELRKSIVPGKGRVIVACDSGQIEARVNAWLWDQDDMLDAFRKSDAYDQEMAKLPKEERRPPNEDERDVYCVFADSVYGRTIWKSDEDERFLGKVAVLGLGYSMGAPKFQDTLAKGALGGPRVNFSLEQCQTIVSTYRTRNHRIADGWKLCSQMIRDMAAGATGHHKCIEWGGDGQGNGWIRLPNGMHLKYPDLREQHSEETGYMEWTYQSGSARKKIYGGLVCENLVQALARIIVMYQMLDIDKKYPVVMTTHDEVVAHPLRRSAQRCYQHMYRCMTTPLWWCQDLPLAAEGKWSEHYF